MVEKEYVSWKDVVDFIGYGVLFCQTMIEAGKQIPGIYGIPRGGMVFAVMLSHKLNLPMLMSPVPGCVIIDDICDSGESLLHYVKNTSGDVDNEYSIITMYYKENNLHIVPNYYMREKGDKWIVFPWEI